MNKLIIKGCLMKLIWNDGAINEVEVPKHLSELINDYLDELEIERNLKEF